MTTAIASEPVTAAFTPLSAADAQQAFRAALLALARPGTIRQLPDLADAPRVPAALVPVLALADLGTPVCVLDEGDGDWSHHVRATTTAPPSDLASARLVAALRPIRIEELAELRPGNAAAPEDGALACLAVAELGTGTGQRLRLRGPGIPGSAEMCVEGLPEGFVRYREALVEGYPTGVDLLLVTADGRMAGLPRTTVLELADEENS
jgi:alpha-D-ribose 1-methylphosphonate 5-triphosphate synthase subunit PhnH